MTATNIQCQRSFRRTQKIVGIVVLSIATISLSEVTNIAYAAERAGNRSTLHALQLLNIDNFSETKEGAIMLSRIRREISATINATDLEPNKPYTVWALVFNYPRTCTSNPEGLDPGVVCGPEDLHADPNLSQASFFWAAGFVTGDSGTANVDFRIVDGRLPTGTDVLYGKGGINDNGVRPGLRRDNGLHAEVHFAIRSHGEIQSDDIAAQLSTFDGGCTATVCKNQQYVAFPTSSF